jgi:hypothetical protein
MGPQCLQFDLNLIQFSIDAAEPILNLFQDFVNQFVTCLGHTLIPQASNKLIPDPSFCQRLKDGLRLASLSGAGAVVPGNLKAALDAHRAPCSLLCRHKNDMDVLNVFLKRGQMCLRRVSNACKSRATWQWCRGAPMSDRTCFNASYMISLVTSATAAILRQSSN